MEGKEVTSIPLAELHTTHDPTARYMRNECSWGSPPASPIYHPQHHHPFTSAWHHPWRSRSWACISSSVNITTVLSPLLLSPFHSSALILFLVSSNVIISGMILQYYHLSAFTLALSNSFSSCDFSDLSKIRNSAMLLFSLTFNGSSQCYAKSCHTTQQFYS